MEGVFPQPAEVQVPTSLQDLEEDTQPLIAIGLWLKCTIIICEPSLKFGVRDVKMLVVRAQKVREMSS
jgi:hypothetical protein